MLGNIEDEKVCSSAPGAHILLQPRGGLQVAEWQSGRLGWSHSSVGDDEASEACMYVCMYVLIWVSIRPYLRHARATYGSLSINPTMYVVM